MAEKPEPLTLAECPIGLFWSEGGELCLKTEYGTNEGRIDAYIVSSGEFFWGSQPQTIANQRGQMVTPADPEAELDAARARIAELEAERERLREALTDSTAVLHDVHVWRCKTGDVLVPDTNRQAEVNRAILAKAPSDDRPARRRGGERW